MNDDELFERRVGASLRASAAERAPDDLVARIGEIPAREPLPRAGAGGLRRAAGFAMNLAGAAVLVVAIAALVLTRNGSTSPPGGQPGGSSGAVAPGASAAAPSPTPTCGRLASAVPAPVSPADGVDPAGSVVVTLGIYSGRLDPSWTLTADEVAGLGATLATLPEVTGAPPGGGLGYHGFTITRPGSTLVAYGGAVAAPGEGLRTMKADPTRSVERCLLEISRSRVTPDEYAVAELAITTSSTASPDASAPPVPPATPVASTSLLDLIPGPASVTFVSADDGWVLGTRPCPVSPCAAIARTADGGRTWAGVPVPPASVVQGTDTGTPGISGLRFADARNGWAFGPDLWATHDGGASWARLAIPGLPAEAPIVALAASDGTVHAVAFDGSDYRVASSPVGGGDFRLSAVRVPVGAGPVPAVQLVLSGSAGWLLENDRTVVSGARLANGTWTAWRPPCADVVGPAYLAASGPTELAVACDVGLWGNPAGDHLYLSHDGGSTFVESPTLVPLETAAQVASASPSVIIVGGSDATGTVLVATFDGGLTWEVVARLGAVEIADLAFMTATQGVVVSVPADGPARLLVTRDGGRTWASVESAGG